MQETSKLKHRIVSDIYRALLKRDPDTGIQYHLQKLDLGLDGNFAATLTEMLSSTEFRARAMDFFKPGALIGSFDHVVGLGSHCYTAFLLKYAGLRRGSHPFDWIFSSPEMVNHCIKDNFREFLRPENIRTVLLNERMHGHNYNKCDNTYYLQNFGVRFVFNHHDLGGDMIARSYFARAVSRFREMLDSSQSILFVQCSDTTPSTTENFVDLCNILNKFNCKSKVLNFAINRSRSQTLMPELRKVVEFGSSELYELNSVSKWRPLDFEDQIDDLAIVRMINSHGINYQRKYFPWQQL